MKPKAERFFKIRFVVEGRGTFPYDMLRYDSCVPWRQEDVSVMADDRNATSRIELRKVQLVAFSASGSAPTVARWASFGWSCSIQ